MSTEITLQQQFETAVLESKGLPEKPSNDTLLKLYALYKQATIGDVNIDPPSNPFDMINKAKYNAWQALKGNKMEGAMQQYVALVDKLKSN